MITPSHFIILVSVLVVTFAWFQDSTMTIRQRQAQSHFTEKCISLRIPWDHLIQEWCRTPEQRRLAIIRLHAQGWSISTIARYLQVSRPTVYAILQRWVNEGVRGLPDKSRANTSKRGVDLPTRNLIRQKQEENPLLGEFRMY